MAILGLLGYLGILTILGYAILTTLLRHQVRPLGEVIFLSLAIGMGAGGTLMFWSSLAGIVPGILTRVIMLALSAAMLIIAYRQRRLRIIEGWNWPAPRHWLYYLLPLGLLLLALY